MAGTPDFAKPKAATIEPYSPRTADRVSDSTRALLAGLVGKAAEKPKETPPPEPEPDAPEDDEDEPVESGKEPEKHAPPPTPQIDERLFDAIRKPPERTEDPDEIRSRYEPRVKLLDEVATKLATDPASALRQLAMAELGLDETQANDLVNQLGEDWARQQLGVEIDNDQKAIRETAKLRRELEAHKRKTRAAEEEEARKTQEREHQRVIAETVNSLGQEISRNKEAFPFLADQEQPGRIVWDVIVRHQQREIEAGKSDVEPLSFNEAAKLANEYYRKQAESLLQRAERYRPLLAPAKQPGQPQADAQAGASESKSKSQNRQPRTLTNAEAAQTPPTTEEQEPQFKDDTERKLYLLRKHLKGRIGQQ